VKGVYLEDTSGEKDARGGVSLGRPLVRGLRLRVRLSFFILCTVFAEIPSQTSADLPGFLSFRPNIDGVTVYVDEVEEHHDKGRWIRPGVYVIEGRKKPRLLVNEDIDASKEFRYSPALSPDTTAVAYVPELKNYRRRVGWQKTDWGRERPVYELIPENINRRILLSQVDGTRRKDLSRGLADDVDPASCRIPASPARLDEAKEIKIGDETHPILPDEELVTVAFPVRKVPDEENAAVEYIEAINLYVELPNHLDDIYQHVIRNGWGDEARELVPWLDGNAPAICAVREGARKKDYRFPVLDKPDEPLSIILLPEGLPKRTLSRLLIVQGKYLEYQRKYREALDTYLVVTRMGYHLSRDPMLISGLIGLAVDSLSTEAIEGCILRNDLSIPTLTDFLEKLDAVGSAAQNYEIAMEGEKAFCLIGVDELLEEGEKFFLCDLESGNWVSSNVLLAVLGRSVGMRAIIRSDVRRYWSWRDKWDGLPDHIALREENRLADKIIEEMLPWSVGKLTLRGLSRARIVFVRAKAVRAVLTTEVALEVFKRRSGYYPQRLDQLKDILERVPMDPFTNETLKYKRTENGYIVYSVGEDLADDGGDGRLTGGGKDIVGRFPLPPRTVAAQPGTP
jgi:hypothetical protein